MVYIVVAFIIFALCRYTVRSFESKKNFCFLVWILRHTILRICFGGLRNINLCFLEKGCLHYEKKNKWLQKLKDSNLKGINSTVISIGALFLLFCIVVIFMLTIIQGKYTIEETFIFFVLALLITFLLFLLVLTFLVIRNGRKQINNRNITYDDMRSYLEDKISEIQLKISSTDESWKEAYHIPLSVINKQQNIINDSIQLNSFLQSYGITKEDLFIDKHAIFCLTPFSLDGLEVFKVVREVCSSKSYRAFRGDEKYIPGDIFSEIIRYIIHSRLIIADLNGKNPNVFYELGIAQAFF